MGAVAHAGKMNIYFKQPPFSPGFGLFDAKCTAFWCKMECVLVQNAVCFGAKRSAFWCKTQGKMVQNAVQFPAKCRSMRINIR